MTRQAKRMAERQAAGLCRLCGSPQADGVALCAAHRDRQRARRRAKYEAAKAAGACVEPACGRPAEGGHVRCAPCHAHFLTLNTGWQRKHRKRGISHQ